jgi:hypothetical protein
MSSMFLSLDYFFLINIYLFLLTINPFHAPNRYCMVSKTHKVFAQSFGQPYRDPI